MKVGFDLDHTIYGFPEIFAALCEALLHAGHELFITSNHTLDEWTSFDCKRLRKIGIDPDWFNVSLMPRDPVRGKNKMERQSHKAKIADQLNLVFDDHADLFQRYTNTPIFKCPAGISADWLGRGKPRKDEKIQSRWLR